ncbi:unnamed protein product [Camellia sinensis]
MKASIRRRGRKSLRGDVSKYLYINGGPHGVGVYGGYFVMEDHNDFDDFPHSFKNYVKSTISRRRLAPMNSGVFWSEDALESESSPTHSSDDPGVLGHVFRQNELAFTPYVMYYTYEKYPQRDDAIKSAVQTSMAFPVIYPSSSRCVGVLELLFTRVFFNALYIVNKVNAELQ